MRWVTLKTSCVGVQHGRPPDVRSEAPGRAPRLEHQNPCQGLGTAIEEGVAPCARTGQHPQSTLRRCPGPVRTATPRRASRVSPEAATSPTGHMRLAIRIGVAREHRTYDRLCAAVAATSVPTGNPATPGGCGEILTGSARCATSSAGTVVVSPRTRRSVPTAEKRIRQFVSAEGYCRRVHRARPNAGAVNSNTNAEIYPATRFCGICGGRATMRPRYAVSPPSRRTHPPV